MSECAHKLDDGGRCVRCGASLLETLLDAKHAELVEVADKLRALRIEHAAGGNEPHWLTKDFNVLYAATHALLLAVGTGDETKTAHALNYVAAQLERLKPAFVDTQEVKRLVRERKGG